MIRFGKISASLLMNAHTQISPAGQAKCAGVGVGVMPRVGPFTRVILAKTAQTISEALPPPAVALTTRLPAVARDSVARAGLPGSGVAPVHVIDPGAGGPPVTVASTIT